MFCVYWFLNKLQNIIRNEINFISFGAELKLTTQTKLEGKKMKIQRETGTVHDYNFLGDLDHNLLQTYCSQIICRFLPFELHLVKNL